MPTSTPSTKTLSPEEIIKQPGVRGAIDLIVHYAERGEALRVAGDRLGSWMSAALDDPNVCAEMKSDIRAWFDAGGADQTESLA